MKSKVTVRLLQPNIRLELTISCNHCAAVSWLRLYGPPILRLYTLNTATNRHMAYIETQESQSQLCKYSGVINVITGIL